MAAPGSGNACCDTFWRNLQIWWAWRIECDRANRRREDHHATAVSDVMSILAGRRRGIISRHKAFGDQSHQDRKGSFLLLPIGIFLALEERSTHATCSFRSTSVRNANAFVFARECGAVLLKEFCRTGARVFASASFEEAGDVNARWCELRLSCCANCVRAGLLCAFLRRPEALI